MGFYNFVECKPDEYTISRGVFKYSGTADAIIVPDEATTISKASTKGVRAIMLGRKTSKVATNKFEWFEVNQENPNFSAVEGVLYSKDKSTLFQYPINNKRDEFEIPCTTKVIKKDAFLNSKLRSILIPDTVATIEPYAFNSTTKLNSIKWPSECKVIDESVFWLSGLKSISLTNTLERIARGAFRASKLESIIVPESVVAIEYGAFEYCRNLKTASLPNSITIIPDDCFLFCEKLEGFVIPPMVQEIGKSAFFGCESLTSVSLPNSIIAIKDKAFGCSGIKTISVPDSVSDVGTIFEDILEVKKNHLTAEMQSQKDAAASERAKRAKQFEEIEKGIAHLNEIIVDLKNNGYIFKQNARRLVEKREKENEKLKALFNRQNYSEYNRLLLEVNEIPNIPVCTYSHCGKNLKVYNRNHIDGTMAFEIDGIVSVLNVFNTKIVDSKTDYDTDASQLDKGIMAGIAGGSLLGYLAVSTANIYNIINAWITYADTLTGKVIVRICFGENYKVDSKDFPAISSNISAFLNAIETCIQDDIRADEKATYTYIRTSLDEIHHSIFEAKETETNRKKKADSEREAARIQKEEATGKTDNLSAAHSDRSAKLRAEKEDAEDRIRSLKAALNSQLILSENKLKALPVIAEINKIDEQVRNLNNEKASLGIFKGKQKKALQQQIDDASAKKTALQKKVELEKNAIVQEIAALKRDTANRISALELRIKTIEEELSKNK